MIGKTLNLKAHNAISIFFKGEPTEAFTRYNEALKEVIEPVMDLIIEHHKKIDTIGAMNLCKTQEQVMGMKVPTAPDNMFEEIAKILNANKGLTDQERLFVLSQAVPAILTDAGKWVQDNMRQRLQRIANEGKSRILKP